MISTSRQIFISIICFVFIICSGCSTEAVVIGTAGTTAAGAVIPAQEVRQIYYLGVFDPKEQLPSTIYRVTIHGQASFISNKKFASGWLPAHLADSLGSNISFNKNGNIQIIPASGDDKSELTTGRRLMLFGPEGFREAPHGHRLAVVMASSPEDFFEAVGSGLDTLAEVQVQKLEAEAGKEVITALSEIYLERVKLESLKNQIERDVVVPEGQ